MRFLRCEKLSINVEQQSDIIFEITVSPMHKKVLYIKYDIILIYDE